MKVRSLDIDYQEKIEKKKELWMDLIKYTNIDIKLIRRAIHHMTFPPEECHEDFIITPKIKYLKKNNNAEYKKVINARKALSALMKNSVIKPREIDGLKSIEQRIIQDYEINLTNKKKLMDAFRSNTDVNCIEEYKDYDDDTFGWLIDSKLNTDQHCEGKLINMIYKYLMPFVETVNEKKPMNHNRDYTQKDVFELIAEILNLHWLNKYDHKKIKIIYRNFQKVK